MIPKMVHAVDGIIRKEDGLIILIRRKGETYHDFWALPGGAVEEYETVEEALVREMKEETGLIVIPIEVLGVFSAVDRDPRGRVISTVFICDYEGELKAGSDAGEAIICPLEEALGFNLAFDHNLILSCYRLWLKQKNTFWSTKKLSDEILHGN